MEEIRRPDSMERIATPAQAEAFIEKQVKKLKEQIGADKVLLALSGGVDSSVVAALLIRAIGKQLVCVHVNHGLLRKGEPEQVVEVFRQQLHANLVYVDATERFLGKLAGVADPETKRKIIGGEFIEVFAEEARKLDGVRFLAQGTIWPDILESEGGIKAHHNAGGLPEDLQFELVEPVRILFKDEVRIVGTALGLPDSMVNRQPFPGPGLGVRCLGAITRDRLEALREADAIVREELDAYNERLFEKTGERNSEHSCWQYFAVLPDIKSVGVMGDERTYDYAVALRAVTTTDFMTAESYDMPWSVLGTVTSRIVNEVKHVNRVFYDCTGKPPATIELE